MSQRAMVDRQSFEQFLAATCFLQQLRQEASRRAADCPQAMDDVYVPGIGVRAALGGDVSEPSTFWPELRENARMLTASSSRSLFADGPTISIVGGPRLRCRTGKL